MNWDWGSIFNISFTTDFWLALASIIFINIILSGDNAVVIALAVRSLAAGRGFRGSSWARGWPWYSGSCSPFFARSSWR